uniref:Putative methyltransferase n=1 Tax=viral metagenome TaxID=1070528 RepID=A0A6H1Z9E5_9ZZZZ
MSTFYAADITYGRHTTGRIFAHRGTVRVGNYCTIGNGVQAIILEDHRNNWISTYPFERRLVGLDTECPTVDHNDTVTIENDVCIGHNVVLLHDTTIRNGAIVRSNSVVCGEVNSYTIVMGNPARVVGLRFPHVIIEKLLSIAWWNWDDETIDQSIPLLCSSDVQAFINKAI